jgi:hypothetical protein
MGLMLLFESVVVEDSEGVGVYISEDFGAGVLGGVWGCV